jgi:hypothetical protein
MSQVHFTSFQKGTAGTVYGVPLTAVLVVFLLLI